MYASECNIVFAWFTQNLCVIQADFGSFYMLDSGKCNIFQHSHHLHINSNFLSRTKKNTHSIRIELSWAKMSVRINMAKAKEEKTKKNNACYRLNNSTNWIDMRVNEILCLESNSFSHQLNSSITSWHVVCEMYALCFAKVPRVEFK